MRRGFETVLPSFQPLLPIKRHYNINSFPSPECRSLQRKGLDLRWGLGTPRVGEWLSWRNVASGSICRSDIGWANNTNHLGDSSKSYSVVDGDSWVYRDSRSVGTLANGQCDWY